MRERLINKEHTNSALSLLQLQSELLFRTESMWINSVFWIFLVIETYHAVSSVKPLVLDKLVLKCTEFVYKCAFMKVLIIKYRTCAYSRILLG